MDKFSFVTTNSAAVVTFVASSILLGKEFAAWIRNGMRSASKQMGKRR